MRGDQLVSFFVSAIFKIEFVRYIKPNKMDNYEQKYKEYGQECLSELQATSLKNVTPEQAVTILEPSHAPENFYCDGEISHSQAMTRWLDKLKKSGLTPLQVHNARRHIFGNR